MTNRGVFALHVVLGDILFLLYSKKHVSSTVPFVLLHQHVTLTCKLSRFSSTSGNVTPILVTFGNWEMPHPNDPTCQKNGGSLVESGLPSLKAHFNCLSSFSTKKTCPTHCRAKVQIKCNSKPCLAIGKYL